MPVHIQSYSGPFSHAARRIIEIPQLSPLPGEGGYSRETYRSVEKIPADALPSRSIARASGRNHGTQIYFPFTPASPSLMHLVQSDEVFHHYSGDPVEQLHPNGTAKIEIIGANLEGEERPQMAGRERALLDALTPADEESQ